MDDDVMEVPEPYQPETAQLNAQYQQSANYPTGIYSGPFTNDPAEKLRFHAQQCLQVLREAHRIRQNEVLMGAIRDLIRHDREELAAVLDGE